MTVETALYPPQLNTSLPQASDMVSEGDDHIRLTKTVIKTTFPNVAGAVSASHTEINYLAGVTSGVQSQINSKGAIAGQTWTGTHSFAGTVSVQTFLPGTSTSDAASTAFVQSELAARLPNYTGPITASTTELNRVVGLNAPVQPQIDSKGAISGQAWSGTQDFTAATITAATAPAGTATNVLATTAFVAAQAFASALPGQTGNDYKFLKTQGGAASWDWPYLTRADVTGTSQAAVSGVMYYLRNTGVTTVTLPPSPVDGDVIGIRADNLRIDNVVDRNGNLLMGLSEDMNIDNPYFPLVLQFRATYGWRLVA